MMWLQIFTDFWELHTGSSQLGCSFSQILIFKLLREFSETLDFFDIVSSSCVFSRFLILMLIILIFFVILYNAVWSKKDHVFCFASQVQRQPAGRNSYVRNNEKLCSAHQGQRCSQPFGQRGVEPAGQAHGRVRSSETRKCRQRLPSQPLCQRRGRRVTNPFVCVLGNFTVCKHTCV